jgi:hypothetical protein
LLDAEPGEARAPCPRLTLVVVHVQTHPRTCVVFELMWFV